MEAYFMAKKFFSLSFFVFIALLPAFALYNPQQIPDSSEIRSSLIDEWFKAPVNSVRANTTELHINDVGKVFQVRAEENGTDLIIIVAPQDKLKVDVYSETGKQSSFIDDYPVDAPGSWVLLRDANSGKPVQIRYYFASDSDVYLQLRSVDGKTYADFIVYGSYAVRGVPVALPFDKLYTTSFTDLFLLTEKTLPWEYAEIVPGLYHPVQQMVAVIRENQNRFYSEEDGAYNEDGNPVYISSGKTRVVSEEIQKEKALSLSSAGFLKWIVDGLVEPLSGSYTKIDPLLVQTVDYKQGSLSDVISKNYNISFSLDWTRNLAAAALSVYSGKNYYYYNSGCDVTIEPFTSKQQTTGWVNSLGYLKETGYQTDYIRPLLYVLAATEPGRFFLGAIRQTDVNENNPDINFFTECAAFFPFFDSDGKFNVVVFEDGKEYTLDAFLKKYAGSYIHLVRINASERFFPQ